ncbi:DnaJ domain-containing protein [bacterium]|nr:DnaJ domain-containing protein [bacterium]
MIALKVLGLEFTNDDETIRKAYLKSLKKYPPEKFPDKYKTVRKAYELIETEQRRLEYYLFGHEDDITYDEYSSVCLNIDKTIPKEKWNKLCQLYQKTKSK